MFTAPGIATIVVVISALLIGLFAFLNNPRNKANRITLALTLVVMVSMLSQNIGEPYDPDRVLIWARLDSAVSMAGNALLLLLACNFPRRLFGRRAEIIYGLISAVIVGLSITPFMIESATSVNSVVTLNGGLLMPLYYVLDTIYVVAVIPALFVQYRRGRPTDKLRVLYLLVGGGVLGLLISLLGLWLPVFFHVAHAVDLVPFVALLGLLLLAYDMVALRLFSIRLVVARSVAYLLLLLTFAGGYYVVALQAGRLIFGALQLNEATQLYQVAVALGLAFMFQPLRRFFEKITDRLFYRDRYDTQQVVNGFSRVLVSEQEIAPLLQRSLDFLCGELHVGWGQVMVYSKGQLFASATHRSKDDLKPYVGGLAQLPQNITVSDELSDDSQQRQLMDHHGIRVAVRLATQSESVGILLLGDKLSGEVYTAQDIGALEIMYQELAVAVQNARAYRQLQVAQAELRQTDEMKSEFIALSSHYLRTPITTLKLVAETLHTSNLPPDANQYVTMLSGVSNELGDFVEELLTISTLEAGDKFAATFEQLTAESLLTPIANQAKLEAQAKGIGFELIFRQKDLKFKANPSHLRIAIRNIVNNAIKFTSSGDASVIVSDENGHCRIEIADTGIGIAPDELKRLFTKFHRGTSFEQFDYAGAGVGLYLAKLVIEEHGGQISVASQPKVGTTVTILLPLAS